MCGLPAALSVMVIAPVRIPTADGVKVTVMVQFVPATTVVPQVLVCVKAPVLAMLVILASVIPVFARVTTWAALVVPRTCAEKLKLVGEKITTGAGGVITSIKGADV